MKVLEIHGIAYIVYFALYLETIMAQTSIITHILSIFKLKCSS
jgi:hypothetical protein